MSHATRNNFTYMKFLNYPNQKILTMSVTVIKCVANLGIISLKTVGLKDYETQNWLP